MMYAHIFEHEEKFYVLYGYPFKFKNKEQEERLKDKILITLFEESGNVVLLDKQIRQWMEANGVEKLSGFDDMSGMGAYGDSEYISQLRQEAHRTAAFLEREREEKMLLGEKLKRAEKFLELAQKVIDYYESADEAMNMLMEEELGARPEGDGCPIHGKNTTFH